MLSNLKISTESPSMSNTAGVVVLFNPEGDLKERLRLILSQVSLLTVVSNDGAGIDRLTGLDEGRIRYIQASGNIGLAAALNIGIAQAAESGFIWCLLLDQDTVIDKGFMRGLTETHAAYSLRDQIGILAPNYRSPGGGRTAYPTDVPWQILETAVTSGSLISIGVLQKVGGMREDFFIEGIDIEFSLRVRAAGFQLVASGCPLMTHSAGIGEERHFFGWTILVGHHPPARCYLQFRNLTWILWRYGRRETHWQRVTMLSIFKRICIVLLFEKQRLVKFWAMLRGTFVGMKRALFMNQEPNYFSIPD